MKILYTGNLYNDLFCELTFSKFADSPSGCSVFYESISNLAVTPDVVIADFNSDLSWRKELSTIRHIDTTIPFIILGTDASEDAPIISFREGADDYIPIRHLDTLSARLANLDKRPVSVSSKSGRADAGLFRSNINFGKVLLQSTITASKEIPGQPILAESVLDTLAVNIAVLDCNGTINYVNRSWTNFAESNASPEIVLKSMVGCNYLQACEEAIERGDEYASAAYVGITGVLHDENPEFQMEYPCDSSTKKRWIRLQVSKIPDSANIIVAHTDISARKLAEEQLKISEMKFRSLLENNREGLALLDANLKPVYSSPSVVEILEYTSGEILKIDLLSLAHPDDMSMLVSIMDFAMANPGVSTRPEITRMRTKSGSWKYVECTFKNMLHDQRINAVVHNFRDVTQEKISHDKLLYSKRLYEIISRVNRIITRTKSESALYDQVCNLMIELGNFEFAWIGTLNENREVEMVANTGLIECDFTFFKNYIYDHQEKVKDVIDGKKPYSLISIADIPAELSACHPGSKCFTSAICLPLKKNGKILGTFNLYTSDVEIFIEQEISLLCAVTDEVSFGIDVIDKERARKFADKQLHIKNAKLSRAQALAQLGNFEVDLDLQVSEWSPELLAMYGLPLDNSNISLAQWLSMVHPEDLRLVANSKERTLASVEGYSVMFRIIRKDGAIRNIVLQLDFERDTNGRPHTMIGVAQDITDLQDMKDALQASEKAFMHSERRYKQIVELANEGIVLLNERNQIVFTNQRMVSMTGYSSEELTGLDLLSLIYKADKKDAATIHRKIISNETNVIEVCLSSKSGNKIWTSIASSRIDDSQQGFTGTIALISDITSRHNAEKDNKFKARLLNNIGQAIVATNSKGVITYWNHAAEDLYEEKSADVIGKELIKITPVEHRDNVAAMLLQTKAGTEWIQEVQLSENQRHSQTILVDAEPMLDDRGIISGVLLIATNVTEQRRLERLLQSSARLARLGHFEIDLVNRSVHWSDLTKEIHDVPQDYQPDFETILQFYENQSLCTVEKALGDAMRNGTDWDVELILTTAKFSKVWVRMIGEVECQNGIPTRIFGSIQDIDAKKQAEIEMQKTLIEKKTILESIGDAFFAVDMNWILTYWNSNAEKVLKKSRAEVIGRSLWDVYPEYYESEAHGHYTRAMETQKMVEFEDFFFSFQKWLEVSVYPSPLGLSIYFKDVTERKLTEIQMIELNENLQDYTTDLISINRELEQFSYIVSHNLRAPVTNILGIAEELGDQGYDEQTKKLFVDSLKLSAKRLDDVIGDLNDVLQLKAGVIEKKETVNLYAFVDSVLDGIDHLVKQQNARITTNFALAPEIVTVKRYLHSIFYNLITNGIKYRQQSIAPVITITSAKVKDGIEFSFSDNGIGLDISRKRKEIFGMYQRFHSHVEGKGIGLFMVKTQVEILGGSVDVESTLNEGTTFKIFIPSKSITTTPS